jgi:hypothetical protein
VEHRLKSIENSKCSIYQWSKQMSTLLLR